MKTIAVANSVIDSLLKNPYVHGNWQALKSRSTSLGDNKHAPSGPVLHKTNNEPVVPTVMDNSGGGMADPNDITSPTA